MPSTYVKIIWFAGFLVNKSNDYTRMKFKEVYVVTTSLTLQGVYMKECCHSYDDHVTMAVNIWNTCMQSNTLDQGVNSKGTCTVDSAA